MAANTDIDAFRKAGEAMRDAIAQFPVYNTVHASPLPLPIDSVVVTRPSNGATGGYAERVICIGENGADDDEKKRQALFLQIRLPRASEFRRHGDEGLNAAILKGLKAQFAKVTLPDGTTLDTHYDFSGKVEKTRKEQLAELKTQLQAIVAQHPQAFLPAEQALLKNWEGYDRENDVYRYSAVGKDEKDRATVEFSLYGDLKTQGEISPAAMIQANINGRKAEILARVKQEAIAANDRFVAEAMQKGQPLPPLFKPEELAQLDFVIKTQETKDSHNVQLIFGTPLAQPSGPAPEDLLAGTKLNALKSEVLHEILMDSILFYGPNAERITPMIADSNDVRELLLEKAGQIPALTTLAHNNPVLMNEADRKAKQKKDSETPKIMPDDAVLLDGIEKGMHRIDVNIPMPKGIRTADVVASMLGLRQISAPSTAQPPAQPVPNFSEAEMRALKDLLSRSTAPSVAGATTSTAPATDTGPAVARLAAQAQQAATNGAAAGQQVAG